MLYPSYNFEVFVGLTERFPEAFNNIKRDKALAAKKKKKQGCLHSKAIQQITGKNNLLGLPFRIIYKKKEEKSKQCGLTKIH